jgi:hypothetical protein
VRRIKLCLAVAAALVACERPVPGLPQHPDPSCSDAAYGELSAKCAAAAARCVAQGGTEAECGTLCDHEADEWQERCQ